MAEYYPLLAKAVASLPNSTPDSRKVVYERARKALIGQLRTLHPPVPDEDIEIESLALDRAIDRLEGELAAPPLAADPVESLREDPPPPAEPSSAPISASPAPADPKPRFPSTGGALGPSAIKPFPPLRTKLPPIRTPAKVVPNGAGPAATPALDVAAVSPPAFPLAVARDTAPAEAIAATPVLSEGTVAAAPNGFLVEPDRGAERVAPSPLQARTAEPGSKPRVEPQRPFAPQPPEPQGPKRRLWIIPVGIGIVVVLIALAAYKLRDRPETLVRAKAPEPQASQDASKIVERVGSPGAATDGATVVPAPADGSAATTAPQQAPQTPANPAAPVAGRAALLVEAPDEPNKVKTYLGTVVWRLDNVSGGQNQAVGLAVRADIDLPDDKLKASVIFQKNVDASLPASHTLKVRFAVQPGSASGNVKEINVPAMRREDSATGEALDGVTVPIVENSFLIGLSPGNSEASNLELLRAREWIDIPIRLSNTRIAKLTFEKTDAGQRDIQEAITAWAKP